MIGNIKRLVNEHQTLMIGIIGVLVICFLYWWFYCKDRLFTNKTKGGQLTQKVACTPMHLDWGTCSGYINNKGEKSKGNLNTVISTYYGMYDISKEFLREQKSGGGDEGVAVWIKCGVYQENSSWVDIMEKEADKVHKKVVNRSKSFTVFLGGSNEMNTGTGSGFQNLYYQGAIWERIFQIMLRNCIKSVGYKNTAENMSIKDIEPGEYTYKSDKSVIYTNWERFSPLDNSISDFEKLMTGKYDFEEIETVFEDKYTRESCEPEFIVIKLLKGEQVKDFLYKVFTLFKFLLNKYSGKKWVFEDKIFDGYCVDGFTNLEKPCSGFEIHPIGWGYTGEGGKIFYLNDKLNENIRQNVDFLDFSGRVMKVGEPTKKKKKTNEGNGGDEGCLYKLENVTLKMGNDRFKKMLNFMKTKGYFPEGDVIRKEITKYTFSGKYSMICNQKAQGFTLMNFVNFDSLMFFLNNYVKPSINDEYKVEYLDGKTNRYESIVSLDVLKAFVDTLIKTVPEGGTEDKVEFYNFFLENRTVNINEVNILPNPENSQKNMSQGSAERRGEGKEKRMDTKPYPVPPPLPKEKNTKGNAGVPGTLDPTEGPRPVGPNGHVFVFRVPTADRLLETLKNVKSGRGDPISAEKGRNIRRRGEVTFARLKKEMEKMHDNTES